jgi:hypothetical protein
MLTERCEANNESSLILGKSDLEFSETILGFADNSGFHIRPGCLEEVDD